MDRHEEFGGKPYRPVKNRTPTNDLAMPHLRDGTEKPQLQRVRHSLIFEVVVERPLPDLPTYSALFEAASWRVDTVHRPVDADRSGPKPAS